MNVLTDEEITAIKVSDFPIVGKHSIERAIENAVIKKIRERLLQYEEPDSKEWESGSGAKLYKVFLLNKKEWLSIWSI